MAKLFTALSAFALLLLAPACCWRRCNDRCDDNRCGSRYECDGDAPRGIVGYEEQGTVEEGHRGQKRARRARNTDGKMRTSKTRAIEGEETGRTSMYGTPVDHDNPADRGMVR